MQETLTSQFKKDVSRFEGLKQNFYLDSKGILTIGIGQNVSQFDNFKNLDIFNKKTKTKLNMQQRVELYAQIMADISGHKFQATNYMHLEIPTDYIYSQFDKMLIKSYMELERKINNINMLPISVRQALVDMQFNIGDKNFSKTKWPKLFDAIDKHDWARAATEASQRKDVQKTRREWTFNKFINAN